MISDPVLDRSYAEFERSFEWGDRWTYFDGTRERFNIAHECLLRHLDSDADRVGARVFHEDGTLDEYTFTEVAEAAQGVRALLDELAVPPNAGVGLAVVPGLVYLGAIFGILLGGWVVVPGSQIMQPSALHSRFSDAGVAVAIVEVTSQLPAVAASEYKVLSRPEVDGRLRGCEPREAVATSGSHPALYIYTSGTTGTPKRVTIPHQGLTLYTTIVGKMVLGLRREDRYLATYSSGYLGGIAWGVLVPMSIGSAAGIYEGRVVGTTLARHIGNGSLSALHCPPTALRRLVTAGQAVGHSVRTLGYSGEPLPTNEAELIRDLFGVEPRAQYGASEVGLVSIDYALAGYEVKPGSLGKPLPGTKVRVVDLDGEEVPNGSVGRIMVERRHGLCPVGDSGYVDGDGYLWFVGRADDLILSAGYTISPVEVEGAIRRLPWVSDVAVVGAPDKDRYERVTAFVEGTADMPHADLAESAVMEVVRDHVGAHAVPRTIRFVQNFPRADGDKIKKNALVAELSDGMIRPVPKG
jgi:acetyl-CoA synthetase